MGDVNTPPRAWYPTPASKSVVNLAKQDERNSQEEPSQYLW
jgi:hypothetical protein